MSKIKLTIVILWSLLNTQALKAQDDDKTVTLLASGQGKTVEEAKQNALRSAIEQAFGAFISSKTEIINDSLIKDEIVSLSSGTVLGFTILNETNIDENIFSVTLNATVSISSLQKIAESKGEVVTFGGALFGMKIKIAKLQKDAEIKVIENMCYVSFEILTKAIDYKLEIGEPSKGNLREDIYNYGYQYRLDEPLIENFNNSILYKIRVLVENKPNKNLDIFIDFFNKTLHSIKMSAAEIEFAKISNLEYSKFDLKIFKGDSFSIDKIYLRSLKSHQLINDLFENSFYVLFNHKINFNFINNSKTLSFSMLDISKYKFLYRSNYVKDYKNVKDFEQAFYIDDSLYVNIKCLFPYIKNVTDRWHTYYKFLIGGGEDYTLFYSDFKKVRLNFQIPNYYDFWSGGSSDDLLRNYSGQESLSYAIKGEESNPFKILKSYSNWNVRYQVYDFYLPLSEIEKINEIKVEPYTGSSNK